VRRCCALETELLAAEIGGVSVGRHTTVRLPARVDEAMIAERAAKPDIGLSFVSRHYLGVAPGHSTLRLSYAGLSEAAIRTGIKGIARRSPSEPPNLGKCRFSAHICAAGWPRNWAPTHPETLLL
jgi:DNA-binding transcriptional MocR family regulator